MQPQQSYGQPAGQPPPGYDFLLQDDKSKGRGPLNFGGGSMLGRIVLGLVGLLLLVIILVIVKNVLGGGNSDVPFLTNVVQDQQELIHLTTNAAQQAGISVTELNFASTAQLSLTSEQSQLITYLQNNHVKLKANLINLKISPTIDTQLTNAVAANTYNSTFQQVMQTELTNYAQALKQAYSQTTGPKGRQLLSDDYNGVLLLQKQLTDAQG